MENSIAYYRYLYARNPKWLGTQAHDMVEHHEIAIMNIKKAVKRLKEADDYTTPELEIKWRAASALIVIKQLEEFLESLTIAQKESTEESNNTT